MDNSLTTLAQSGLTEVANVHAGQLTVAHGRDEHPISTEYR